MRKLWWIFVLIFFCAQSAVAGPLHWRLTKKNIGKLLKLKRDTVAVIELDANPSTGYVWQENLPENGPFKIVGRQFVPTNPGMLGSPGVEKIYVAGRSKGRAALAFMLKRAHDLKEAKEQLSFDLESEGSLQEKFTLPALNLPEPQITGFGAFEATEEPETIGATPSIGVPSSFNFCDQMGGCTPIKNQGQCGACWAFSTVGVLENLIKFQDSKTLPLSEQYLISCNKDGFSCYGGWWAHDYHQWKKGRDGGEAGAVSQASKPFLGRNGTCGGNNSKVAKIIDWGYVGRQNGVPSTDAIKEAIYTHGPVAAAVCVNYRFSYYSGGIFSGPGCTRVNHGVVLVGWNDDGGYWILRNSYGAQWGENGYMRIKYGVSNIGWGASWVDYKGGLNTSATSTDTIPTGCDETSNGGCN